MGELCLPQVWEGLIQTQVQHTSQTSVWQHLVLDPKQQQMAVVSNCVASNGNCWQCLQPHCCTSVPQRIALAAGGFVQAARLSSINDPLAFLPQSWHVP